MSRKKREIKDEKSVVECLEEEKEIIEILQDDVDLLKDVVFGNEERDEKGMKAKVDEMHEILITVKNGRNGIIWFSSLLIAIGAIYLALTNFFK